VAGAVDDLAPLLVGQDPRAIERHWQTMVRGSYFRGGIVQMSAIAGIDQALWDIKAKDLGLPLFELLGGPVRDRVRTYVNLGSELGGDARDPESWSDAARACREAGFDAMKVYPLAPVRSLEGTAAVREAAALLERVRGAAGDDADVMVDLHGRTSPALAIQVGLAMIDSRPLFLEEPCQPGNADAVAEVSRALPIPIATGERLCSGQEFRELLERRACAVIQPNACYCGGITGFLRIAAQAEASFVAVAPHNPNGPIGSMVSIHLALAVSNVFILEQVRDDVPWRRDIVGGALGAVDGYVSPPTGPGIGVGIDDAVATAHPGRSPRPHLVFAPDGGLLDW
jgi:galactonate dehydratase